MSTNSQKSIDIKIGMRFSNCIVKAFDYHIENYAGRKTRRRVVVCKCDCGKEFTAFFYRLRKGTTSSCGPCKKKLNGSQKIIDLRVLSLPCVSQVIEKAKATSFGGKATIYKRLV